MTDMFGQEKPSLDDVLEHHGVLGMKWGVRRGGLGSRVSGAVDDSFQRRITSANAIATGDAKLRDRYRSATTTPTGIIPSKKIAARRVRILSDRRERFSQGEATAGDILSAVGHTRVKDLVVSRRDKRGADANDAKNVVNVNQARKSAGDAYVKSKQNAELMNTKVSAARADRTKTSA